MKSIISMSGVVLLTLKVADGTAGWPACRAVGQLRGWVE
jgi:hypothetical protein